MDKLRELEALVQRTLRETEVLSDLVHRRMARPYYPLNDNWALTHLDSGEPFFINTEDRNITPWILMGGHWEPDVTKVVTEYIRPGMKVVDIGANVGYYTVKMGKAVGPSGFVWAFEPNPEVNTFCWENIKINELYRNASLGRFALGEAACAATLTRSNSNMASANLLGEQDADYCVDVEVKTLDSVLPRETIDFIKMDAEGYEAFILKGAKDVLSRSPDCVILLELGLERWEKHASLNELLPLCGGRSHSIYKIERDGLLAPISEDGLKPTLMECGFHECYMLIGPSDLIESRCRRLISSPTAKRRSQWGALASF